MKVWCVSFFIPGHGYGTLEEGWLTEAEAQAVVEEQTKDPDMEGVKMFVFSVTLQVTLQ
ncbi:hypothetical protein [Erwinia phage Pecta]|nr:hypothetical protein [Erwinia phage Pecta]